MSAPRVIALWLPDWPIVALRREEPRLSADAPIAIITDGAVSAVSAAGHAAGVTRGLRRREAQSRCPSIVLRPADAERDVRGFEPIVAGLETVVPGVAVLRPGFCVIRAAGPAAYFGAERAAAEALVGRVADLGATAVAGVADGVFTAARAARGVDAASRSTGVPARSRVLVVPPGRSPEFLADVPITVLADEAAAGDALVGLLVRLGVRTLGAFAALPADDVLDRFGAEGLALHRRAAGLDERAAAPRIPPPEFTVTVSFEPPLELAEQVAFGVRAEAERFIEAFTTARLACTGIRVAATDADGGTSDRVWLHPSAFSPADVADRVRWQLGGATVVRGSTADAASRLRSGIAQVRIAPESVDPIGVHEPGLWGGGPDERVHRALARLQSMLGHGAVLRPELGGGRDPRERHRGVPWGDRGPTRTAGGPWPGRLPSPSPGSVFDEPHPVLVADASGRDVVVSRRGAVSAEPARLGFADRGLELTGWAGPWPVLRHDSPDGVPRWRFQVVDEHGCGWLLVREADGWWAHARYD
jgi:protein ImuB